MMVEVRCFWVTFKSFKMLGKVSTILLRLSEVWFGRSGQLVKKEGCRKLNIQVPIVSLLVVAASGS